MSLSEAQLEALRKLPPVNTLADEVRGSFDGPAPSNAESIHAARESLHARRVAIEHGQTSETDLVGSTRTLLGPGTRPVINATGVILHTNLGRAPLAASATAAVAEAGAGYVDLEFDLDSGRRGRRADATSTLLADLTAAEDALIVNNGAAAVLLAVAALAGGARPTIVSRGDAIEIGGGFRIPEVIAQAGSELLEVGTANKTRASDYSAELENRDALVLRVHRSNFRTVGFVEQPEIEDLCSLGADVVDDLGSGALLTEQKLLDDEPSVRRSVQAGAQAVCFSGDKLLGGPQAGLIVGRSTAIERCRRHPLARALRVDRMTVAALHATLSLYRDPERAVREIPVLAMLAASDDELLERAEAIATGVGGAIVRSKARVGGGTLPLLELEGPVVAVPCSPEDVGALADRLRKGHPPLIGRITQGRLVLDPRTISSSEVDTTIAAVSAARGTAAFGRD